MAKKVYVGGSKGGVGKSMVSSLGLNCYIAAGEKPILIDTDNSNPDVYKTYHDDVEAYALNIDKSKGWEKMVDIIGEHPDSPIIINSAARNVEGIREFGGVLDAIEDVVTLWPVNTERDSLVLLKDFLQTVHTKICIIKNGYFGKNEEFSLLEQSKFASVPSVYLPQATDAIRAVMYNDRVPFHKTDALSFGGRLLGNQWLLKATDAIKQAIEQAATSELA